MVFYICDATRVEHQAQRGYKKHVSIKISLFLVMHYRLSFANRTQSKISKKMCEGLLEISSQYIKRPRFTEKRIVILTFIGDSQMRSLNKKHRGKDKTTDVLSFEYRADAKVKEGIFGEILISVPQAKRQAKKLSHRLQDEIAFLFVHGFLHIHGYDHEKPQEEKVMFALTDKILDAL